MEAEDIEEYEDIKEEIISRVIDSVEREFIIYNLSNCEVLYILKIIENRIMRNEEDVRTEINRSKSDTSRI